MRSLFRTIVRLTPVLAMLAVTPVLASAQAEIDSAFSDTLIRELGYPEVTVEVSRGAITAPAALRLDCTSSHSRPRKGSLATSIS